MNHNIPNLQVRIHKVDGSTTTFVQTDAGEVKKLLDGFQPAQIFERDKITVTDKNSITSLPVDSVPVEVYALVSAVKSAPPIVKLKPSSLLTPKV